MKIRMDVNGTAVTATLDDNETSREFVSLLPLTLTLEDYNSTEKISNLAKKLSTKGARRNRPLGRRYRLLRTVGQPGDLLQGLRVFARPREARADRFTRGRVPAARNAASDDSPNRGVTGRERLDQDGRRGVNDERQGD
jgi:hypothetical protein